VIISLYPLFKIRIVLESKIMRNPSILLASNSPRRQQMLVWTGWEFETGPVPVDETPAPTEAPEDYVLRLAQCKIHAALPGKNQIVLGADTVVSDSANLLGKPQTALEANRMLRSLRGRTHQVFTALAVLVPASNSMATDLCRAEVPMRAYSDQEIADYIETGDPLDKAGAYAIQHGGFHPVINFKGCYACVMGLPLCHLVRTLRKLEIQTPVDVPSVCQAKLNYACPVSEAILSGEM
jgi:septum formation protein